MLDRLCSFELLPESDYLDLDWAPTPLIRACEAAHVSPPVLAALRRALDGDSEINPAYRDRADTVWQHPVNEITADVVAELATLLARVEPEIVLAALPHDGQAASKILGTTTFEEHPGSYLRRHFVALRAFYVDAADRQLAIAIWWD